MIKRHWLTLSGAARPLLTLTLLLVALGCMELPTWAAKPKPSPQTHTIIISSFAFQPETLTVNAGDTVIWKNQDLVPHTATAEGKGFDSKSIAANASWKFIARRAGSYPYLCTFHPTMKARLIVK